MLPGFRFLFAAIVLSMSILVFGLGAAALLRAAHEEFASNPSWHATRKRFLRQQNRKPTKDPSWRCCASSHRPRREKAPDQAATAEAGGATRDHRAAEPEATAKPVEPKPPRHRAKPEATNIPAALQRTAALLPENLTA